MHRGDVGRIVPRNPGGIYTFLRVFLVLAAPRTGRQAEKGGDSAAATTSAKATVARFRCQRSAFFKSNTKQHQSPPPAQSSNFAATAVFKPYKAVFKQFYKKGFKHFSVDNVAGSQRLARRPRKQRHAVLQQRGSTGAARTSGPVDL